MSYYYLIITFIIAILAIIYIWYISREYTTISDDKILSLETNDNKLLSDWYSANIKPSFNYDLDENEIAAKLVNRIYNIEINSNLLVIGFDIKTQYYSITHNQLPSFQGNKNIDCMFDLRSIIGKEGEIVIIHNKRILNILRKNNNYDINELNEIIKNDLDMIAYDYLTKVLKYRHEKLIELNDPNILKIDGTYVYFKEWNIMNINTDKTNSGYRINLLCNDLEFETLIKRMKSNLMLSI